MEEEADLHRQEIEGVESIDLLKERLQDLSHHGRESVKNMASMERRKADMETELHRQDQKQNRRDNRIKKLKENEQKCIKSIEAAEQRLQQKVHDISETSRILKEKQAERKERRETAQAKKDAAEEHQTELQHRIQLAREMYEDLEPRVQEAHNECRQAQSEVSDINRKIKSLQKNAGTSLAVFGQHCVTVKSLVDQYQREGKFQQPVLGPIGSYLKVRPGKEMYAELVETAIGEGVLDRFVVFNDHDRKVFLQLRREAGVFHQCGIFQQSSHARYRVMPAPQGVETILSVLTVEDDDVFNCLVDSCKFETKALCEEQRRQ